MNIHLKIKECVNKRGAEIIVTNTLISILDDEQVFDEVETLPYKKILRNIIKEGYAQRLLDLGGYSPEVNFLASQYAQENLMQEAPIQYVLDCLAYGLGWTSNEPTLQTPSSKIDKEREEAEEKIRKGKELYKPGDFDKYDMVENYLKEGLAVINDAEAQYILGDINADRGLVSQEASNEAIKWFRMAAEKGHVKAACGLGEMLADEDDEDNYNIDEAIKWFRLAAEKGEPDSLDYLKELAQDGVTAAKACFDMNGNLIK